MIVANGYVANGQRTPCHFSAENVKTSFFTNQGQRLTPLGYLIIVPTGLEKNWHDWVWN
jgi:hypothetical protein